MITRHGLVKFSVWEDRIGNRSQRSLQVNEDSDSDMSQKKKGGGILC